MHEMILPVESQTSSFHYQKPLICDTLTISRVDVPFTLANGDRQVRHSNQPVTLYLTVVLSESPSPTSYPVLPVNTTALQSVEVNASTPSEPASAMAQDSTNITRSTVPTEILPPPTDHLPGTPMPPVAYQQARMPPVEDALHNAKEAMTTISHLSNTWEDALSRIKWVMDTVSPVAEVRYDVRVLAANS